MNKSERSAGILSKCLSSCIVVVSVSTCHDDHFCEVHPPSTFTVWKSSLFLDGKGFTVFDSSGNLVFRVDDYSIQAKDLSLMDAAGNILLTLSHKRRLSFNQRWDAFRGDGDGCEKPAFTVITSVLKLFSSKPSAKVVINPIKGHSTETCHYQMKGYLCKPTSSFTLFRGSGEIVAQARRKQATSEVMLGDDVLSLVVQHGIDQTLVMALLIIHSDIQK